MFNVRKATAIFIGAILDVLFQAFMLISRVFNLVIVTPVAILVGIVYNGPEGHEEYGEMINDIGKSFGEQLERIIDKIYNLF